VNGIRVILLVLCAVSLTAVEARLPEQLAEARDQQRAVADLLLESYVFVGGGSGVLISPNGLVLSNYHVTGDKREWTLRLADGRSFDARLLARDPFGDLSLLKIDSEGETFTHVELGSAEHLAVGQRVLAIGNPFSMGDHDHLPAVTVGTLGAVRVVRRSYGDCLQFDAPVNPGNSGGPLLDLHGRLLGINGMIRTRTGLRINSGIGFAIACTQLREFLPLLQTADGGFVHHRGPPAGLELSDGDDGLVRVSAWQPDDETQRDLLAVDDVLIAIDDRPVSSLHAAQGFMTAMPWRGAETRIPLLIERGGVTHTVQLPASRTPIPGKVWHGLSLIQRRRDGERVLVVGGVDGGSPAARAGVAVGWRVRSAGEQDMRRRLDFLKVLVPLEIGDRLPLVLVDHHDQEQQVELLLEPRP